MNKPILALIALLIIASLILGGCGGATEPTTTSTSPTNATSPPTTSTTLTPTTTPTLTTTTTGTQIPTPSDTTPPPTVTGLIAHNAYDGKINLWWDKSTAEDFDHYNIYINKAPVTDITAAEPFYQINDIADCVYQATGLENGTTYYFAVTAVDKSGNEDTQVSCIGAVPTPMARGTVDSVLTVDIYQSDKAWAGTTILPDNHDPTTSRIIEVNMLGEIIWEYMIPADLKQYTNPGFDAELLENNHILYLLPGKGIYEIDRSGNVVWSYMDAKVSHDVDRLPNGNTLFVFGNSDQKTDAQVKEIDPAGNIVWSWYARDYFDKAPYDSIFNEGWTHTNAVSRMANGNTLISPRNFNLLVEVDPSGEVIATYGDGIFIDQHDPAWLPNGNILLANHGRPHQAIEFNPTTGEIVWKSPPFELSETPVRDANRLPNGNTLITASTKIVEITPDGEVVWQMILKGITFIGAEAASLGFYKAERLNP